MGDGERNDRHKKISYPPVSHRMASWERMHTSMYRTGKKKEGRREGGRREERRGGPEVFCDKGDYCTLKEVKGAECRPVSSGP